MRFEDDFTYDEIAKEFNIPFYVAIPFNTIDWNAVNYESIKMSLWKNRSTNKY